MARGRLPVTPAIRFLRDRGVAFTEHPYRYEDKGGTAVCARELHIDEHRVIKTLVMEDEVKRPLIVLMHGDMEVSTKELARRMGSKRVSSCAHETAQKHTGYLVGGISPFGARKNMPVYMEESILAEPLIYINGGRRGLLVSMAPGEIIRVLEPTLVSAGIR